MSIDLSKIKRVSNSEIKESLDLNTIKKSQAVKDIVLDMPVADIDSWVDSERLKGNISTSSDVERYQKAIELKMGKDLSIEVKNKNSKLGFTGTDGKPQFLLSATAFAANLYIKNSSVIQDKIYDINGKLGNINEKINRMRSKLDRVFGGREETPNNNLDISKFVVFINQNNLPDNFIIQDNSLISSHILTNIFNSKEVMSIQILEQETKIPVHTMYFLVNPSSLSVNYEKSYTDYITRNGPDSDYWGNKAATLDFSGTSGGFYGLDEYGSGYGIQYYLRTLSFKNILSLVSFYKNNGFFYRDPSDQRGSIQIRGDSFFRSRDIVDVGLISINYRGRFYIGSFDDMSVNFSDNDPLKCSYSFSFTAYETIELVSDV